MQQERRFISSGALAVLLAVGSMLPAAAADPPDYGDFSELDLESLLDQTIVTASKHEQKLSESPVAATVITAEEIALSGARSIPEVLRDVPGLDVIQGSSSGYDVSARGLNKPAANSMLVMVDGRSVYVDIYGLTMWEQISVSLEDIQAIEVIKGPGSAMHGANAFAGVINIITTTPGERPGTSLRTMVSSRGEAYGSLRHSGRSGDLSWKLNTTWDEAVDWDRVGNLDRSELESENVRWDGQVRHQFDDGSWVGASAGHVNGNTIILPSDIYLTADGTASYLRADYRRGGFSARWFLNDWDLILTPIAENLSAARTVATSRVHDIEVQQSLHLGRAHHLLLGASYRNRDTDFWTNGSGDGASDHTWAGYFLEEWRPGTRWNISAGIRLEDHRFHGLQWSPRCGLVFKPAPQHAVRASYSHAYRAPSYLETSWYQAVELLDGLPQILRGDMDNESEEIRAFELGYQGLLRHDVLLNLAIFRNEMDGIISMESVAFYPSPPAPFPGIPSELAFVNTSSWTSTGGELSLQADPASWLRLSGQYSYVWLEDEPTGAWLSRAPKHHGSLRARFRPGRGHQVALTLRHRSRAGWSADSWADFTDGRSPAFTIMDATWSLRLDEGAHQAVIGVENIFDERYQDHPLAIEHRQRFLASVTLSF